MGIVTKTCIVCVLDTYMYSIHTRKYNTSRMV